MNEQILYSLDTLLINWLQFVRSDVFALTEFEDIFFAVNNPYSVARLFYLHYITTLQPSVFESLPGLLLVLIVAPDNIGSPSSEFSPGKRVSFSVFVLVGVVHFRNIHNFKLVELVASPDVPTKRILRVRDDRHPAVLGLAIPLDERTPHGGLEELHHFSLYWSRPGDQPIHSPSQYLLELAENYFIVKKTVVVILILDVVNFRLESPIY